MYAIISAVSPMAISSVSIAHFSYSSGLPNDPNAARPRGRSTCRPRGFQIQRFPDASACGRGTANFPVLKTRLHLSVAWAKCLTPADSGVILMTCEQRVITLPRVPGTDCRVR
jgi:hypothetical protein